MGNPKQDYRSLSEELDKILDSLQNGGLDIDEATKVYEKGMQLVEKLENYLKTAQNQVAKVKATFDAKKE